MHAEIVVLRAKAEMYLAIASVLLVIIRGVDVGTTRVPEATDKAKLLRAIKAASRYAPLHRILGLIGLSLSRLESQKIGLRTGRPVELSA